MDPPVVQRITNNELAQSLRVLNHVQLDSSSDALDRNSSWHSAHVSPSGSSVYTGVSSKLSETVYVPTDLQSRHTSVERRQHLNQFLLRCCIAYVMRSKKLADESRRLIIVLLILLLLIENSYHVLMKQLK
jgi:hypothetical protein